MEGVIQQLAPPVRVLSDLHLGHPACRLDSVEPLRPLIQGARSLVLNGDTWEQLNPVLAAHAEILYQDLLGLLNELEITPAFIRGNHDARISKLDWIGQERDDLFITHGDCLFETISPWNPKTWTLSDKYARIHADCSRDDLTGLMDCVQRCRLLGRRDEHRFRSGRFRIARSVFKLIFPPRRPWEILRCWRETPLRADQFRRKHRPGAKILIMGHVHRPGIWQRPDGYTLINTGGFMSIGKARVVEWDDKTIRSFRVDEANPAAFALREDWSMDLEGNSR